MQEYSTLDNITNSLKLAWKYKILWVFVLLTAGSMSAGGNSNLSRMFRDFNEGDSKKNTTVNQYKQNSLDQDIYDYNYKSPVEKVLGSSTTLLDKKSTNMAPTSNPISEALELFSQNTNIWLPYAIILFMSLFIALVFGITVNLIKQGWGKGALIDGTAQALVNETLNLKNLSQAGMDNFGQIIKLSIYLALFILSTITFLLILPSIVIAMLSVKNSGFIAGILMFIIFIIFLLILVAAYFAGIYALRFVVLNKTSYREAFKNGWKLFKNNKKLSLSLAAGNFIVAMAFFVAVLITVGIAAMPLVAIVSGTNDSNEILAGIFVALLLVPLFIITLLIIGVMQGYVGTANEISFTTLFKHLTQSPKDQSTTQNLQGVQTS